MKENLNYHKICKDIYALSRSITVAVFAINGDVTYYPMGSKKYEYMLKYVPGSFVGVYNKRATIKMIQDDIL